MPVSVSGMPMSASGVPMSANGMPMPADRARMYAPGTPVSLQAMQAASAYSQQQACASAGMAQSAYRQQVAMPAPGYPPNTIAYAPGYTTASPYQLSTGPYPAASMALSGSGAGYASAYSMPAVAHANMYQYSPYRGMPMSSQTAAAVAYQQQQQQQQAMPQHYATAAQIQRPASSYSPPGAQPTSGGATYPAGSYTRGMPPL